MNHAIILSVGIESEGKCCTVTDLSGRDYRFTYDKVFPEESSQDEVFEFTAKRSIKEIFDGYNRQV